jgi:hypothetical protein
MISIMTATDASPSSSRFVVSIPPHTGHGDIHKDDVRLQLVDHLQRFLSGGCVADNQRFRNLQTAGPGCLPTEADDQRRQEDASLSALFARTLSMTQIKRLSSPSATAA